MASKKIYFADDDDNIRETIKAFLENEGYVVTAFDNGNKLLAEFREVSCDLIILDVMMPGSNGFTICSEIRKISTVPIIMLTARDSDIDYATGLSLGSDDYFTKPFSAISLIMRVKSIFRRIEFERQNHLKQNVEDELRFGDIVIDEKSKCVNLLGENLQLTPNEFALLCYLTKNSERAVSRDELLDDVWGFKTEVETKAVDDTIHRLRKKIAHSNVEITAIWGFGFRLKVRESNE